MTSAFLFLHGVLSSHHKNIARYPAPPCYVLRPVRCPQDNDFRFYSFTRIKNSNAHFVTCRKPSLTMTDSNDRIQNKQFHMDGENNIGSNLLDSGASQLLRQCYNLDQGKLSRRDLLKSLGFLTAAGLWIPKSAWSYTSPTNAKQCQDKLDVPSAYSKFEIPDYLKSIASKVHTFKISNGATFVVMERDVSPTISFITHADVGGVDEEDGMTGIAHFLEHLAFKGTRAIGTTDYKSEKVFLDKINSLQEEKKKLQNQESKASKKDLQDLDVKIAAADVNAENYVVQNGFGKIVQKEGGVGLNAATSADDTQYYYNFPSNKLELWMALESERFQDPVFRQFYKERNVILEERRLRVDNDSIGKFLEEFELVAFEKHPYRRPVIGYQQDIEGLMRVDVENFFHRYYVPSNMTYVIVGDVKLNEVKDMAKEYFGRFEARACERRVIETEPVQTSERKLDLKLNSEPYYFEAYHTPALDDSRTPALQVLEGILSDGRTSRFYRNLVYGKMVALGASFGLGSPGNKYPNLGITYAVPSPGVKSGVLADALREEFDKVKIPGNIQEEEMNKIKLKTKKGLLASFESNAGLANLLAEYAVKTGDAMNLFRAVGALDGVTVNQVTLAAQETLTENNRTVGRIL